jgi:ubiquinone/menaquinone biosynthesis C-methylase UbiE
VKLRAQQSQWEQLGRTDPLWAILTDPDRQHGGWKTEEFFATGVWEIDALMTGAASLGLPTAHSAALDFGCGVGRLTQALAAHFEHVTGVDIAPAMLEQAEGYNRHGERCRYVLNQENRLPMFSDGSFDLVCSQITLQHLPPRHIRSYLRELVRVLRPGGLLVFQLPDSYRSLRVRLKCEICRLLNRRLRRVATVMEMYGIPRKRVQALLEECGATVLRVEEDPIAGEEWLSYRYFVSRT